jgi:hypothetical protein
MYFPNDTNEALNVQKQLDTMAKAASEAMLGESLYKEKIRNIPFEVFSQIWSVGYIMGAKSVSGSQR